MYKIISRINVVQKYYRFRYEQLLFNRNKEVENANIDSNNAYRKRVAFIVHTHREALK